MCGVAEPVNTKTPSIARFAIGSVTDQSGAKQGRDLNVIVTLRELETVSSIRDGELGVAPIEGITGKPRIVAEVFSAGSAIRAITIGPAEPRDSHTIADREV